MKKLRGIIKIFFGDFQVKDVQLWTVCERVDIFDRVEKTGTSADRLNPDTGRRKLVIGGKMWAATTLIGPLTLLLLACARAGAESPGGGSLNVSRSLVVAHDVPAGYGIDRWSGVGGSEFRLLRTPHSERFALVDNGLLMTTQPLDETLHLPQPLMLWLAEETPARRSTHAVQIFVVRRQHLLHFTQNVYRGRVDENLPAGSAVQDLADLRLADGSGVVFDVIGGSEFFRIESVGNSSRAVIRTLHPLDRESQPVHDLVIRAQSPLVAGAATCRVLVTVGDVNDNAPQFKSERVELTLGPHSGKFDRIGQVEASDADGDGIVYKLLTATNNFVVVPQTGEILLAEADLPLNRSFMLQVSARDRRNPALESVKPATVIVSSAPAETEASGDHPHEHNLVKRRAPRALRPTKRIEFTEADGQPEGKLMFQLEKSMEKERFKIRDDNPWVTVEPNGNVRVKRKWDYEELGPEKTIDFWVTITNTEGGGECADCAD